jgi:hypothetical protein
MGSDDMGSEDMGAEDMGSEDMGRPPRIGFGRSRCPAIGLSRNATRPVRIGTGFEAIAPS